MAMVKPIIPQTKTRFVGETLPRVLPSIGETVAVLVTHDWGPLGSELNAPEVMAGFDEWVERYGDSDTEGRTAVAEAFVGHGIAGLGGAGGVIPYRMGTNARRSLLTIRNTAGSPEDALTITALWTGTRGDRISVVIDADPADATNRQRLRVRYNGAVVETYTYARTDVAALGAAINARAGGYVTARVLRTGTALATTAGTPLAGGANGDALVSQDYLSALDGLEYRPFTLLAAANLTDSTIQAAILAWIQVQEEENRPIVWVVGGRADETLDNAITRTNALADPHVVNFGVGLYHDDLLDKDLSTAQLAPRIAGILAARGRGQALTGAELGGLHIVGTSGVTTDDAKVAVQRGVTVAIRTESPDADLRIAKGLTTFTSEIDGDRPREIFEEPRFVRIMDLFVRDMRIWGDRRMLGNVPVNDDSRDAVRQQANILIDELLSEGLILTVAQGGSIDPFVTTPVTTDDTLPFQFGWHFARTANYILGEGKVR